MILREKTQTLVLFELPFLLSNEMFHVYRKRGSVILREKTQTLLLFVLPILLSNEMFHKSIRSTDNRCLQKIDEQ